MRWPGAWVLMAVVSLLLGCSDQWVVVKQGPESAFKGMKTFQLVAMNVEGAKIEGSTESDFESGEEVPSEQWVRGKPELLAKYPHYLRSRLLTRGIELGDAGPTITPVAERIVVAQLYTVDNNPNYLQTQVSLKVTLSDGGDVIDEITIEQSAHGFATKPAEARFGEVGKNLALITGEYVSKRAAE